MPETAPPRFTCEVSASDQLLLTLTGQWTLDADLPDIKPLRERLDRHIQVVRFNCQDLQQWDTLLLLFVHRVEQLCRQHHITIDLRQLPQGTRTLVDMASRVPPRTPPASKTTPSPLARIGQGAINSYEQGRQLATFTGEISLACAELLRGRAPFPFRNFFYFLQSAGAAALPIVSLISFLVGIILAFVGAVQLQMFGAQIYVANLVGLAMVMEMGAMMSGVIMAGRTGAAYAAQLGTMQVNEEIDALRTLGISPVGYLVLPRMLALMLMMPLLCIYADIIGILGGAFIGVVMLDLSLTEYFLNTQKAITLDQCFQGVIKSCVYGVLVGYAGCLRGLQCGRSAAAVGVATTSAVVTGIVLIIIADALLTFLFHS